MEEKTFVPLGLQSPEVIQAKLEEIGDVDRAVSYSLESTARKRPWLDVQHQYGFIPPFTPGEKRHHPIISASNMPADDTLKGQRINVRLGYLRVYQYPKPLLGAAHSVHTILFTFEARNQVEDDKEEPVAFNQLYKARSGQDAAVIGQPIFIGLTVGPNGVGFACKTVNVSNSTDEDLVTVFESDAVTAGLNLLTTAQPALMPLTTLARGLCVSLASHNRNVPVQDVRLGLDFDTGQTGARLAVGSYVVAQTSRPDEIAWSEWAYDADTGTIMRHPDHLAEGERPYPLPHNAFVFRVSRYAA
jgi:hypothetical protein